MKINVEAIKDLTKQQQFTLMNAVRPYLPQRVSQAQIAREANVTGGLVQHVFAGTNSNPVVLTVIFSHLTKGWEDEIPRDLRYLLTSEKVGA